jgi:serine/threonine protein phosphatase PrpC
MTPPSTATSDMSDTGEHSAGAAGGEVVVHVFGRTDVGKTREHNEDAFLVADLTTNQASLQPQVRDHKAGPKGTLFMVADGMGGAAAGEIASQMATDTVLKELRDNWLALENPSPESFGRCLRKAAQTANHQIHSYATSHQEYRGMGTTATIAGLLGDTLYLAQVGDSRAYLMRDGELRQITKDQSLMQKLIEAGELTEEEAAQSERRNIILQALGPEPNIKVDLTYQQVRKDDTLMLCSDGLSGYVSKNAIADTLRTEKDLIAACKRLIELANLNGGPDNITCIVARFDGEGLEAASDGDDVGHRVFTIPEPGQTAESGRPTQQRISEGPTSPMASARRTAPVAGDGIPLDEEPVSEGRLIETDVLDQEDVDQDDGHLEARRGRGRVIAFVLLAVLLLAAGWFVMRTVINMKSRATPSAAPASSPASP